ncbi:MAG: chorismate-binding protein [Spirosomaceae bacterium]|jgi:isochorismate synthase|nr:chorismate-binding protein [Spirosomataceae bacterium]
MTHTAAENVQELVTTSAQVTPQSGWQAGYDKGFAVALWRLPRQTDKRLIVNLNRDIPRVKANLEDLPAGFVVSPFLNLDATDSLFIEADLYFRFDEKNEILTEQSAVTNENTSVTDWLKQTTQRLRTPRQTTQKLRASLPEPQTKNDYQTLVQTAIEAIEAGKMQKVVLSRNNQIEWPDDLCFTEVFERLCQKYPNAFVSLVYLPQLQQVWLGATPEILVSVDEAGVFRTVSLAGTQSALGADGQPISPKHATWTQKEIEEQAFVSRYIIECFKKIRVREFVEEGPKTVIAGNLMHLRTDYTVDTKAINFPEMGSVMLELLHPTSAVCGMPKFASLQFIQEHEGYHREFYSGFLGPVNVENASHLFVNLRCMKVQEGVATLYAGGGITEDSVPEKEWQETELKMQTMLAVLNP